jgi:twinkle protein
MATVDDILITEKEVAGYMEERGNEEHLKIRKPSEYAEDVEKFFSEDINGGTPLPFDKTLSDFRIRLGELSIVSGYSGHGKTAWLSYVMLHLMRQHKTLIASFEMLPKATLGRLCMQSDNPDPTPEYIQEFLAGIEDRLWLYDAEGETSVEKVLEVIYYGAEKLDIKLFVVDSLMKCGINEDDLNGQKAFANKLAVASRDLGVHIFLVAHSRKTADESGSPSKFDVAGSANITNLADNSISVHRNKRKELAITNGTADEDQLSSPDCTVYLNKQRHGNGKETKWGFWFDPRTFRYRERR